MKKDIIKKALILGFSFILAIFLVKPIGVSTEYSVTSGIIEKTVNHEYNQHSYYTKDNNKILDSIDNPVNYNIFFVASIPLGGLLAYIITSNKRKKENIPNYQFKDYLKLFIGGFLLLFGARLASGCTSGHMMSGIMQSSVSGLVFAGSVFASGIIFSLIKNRRKS